MIHAVGRLSRWLQSVMDTDVRYICAACDDRFADRADGVTHVVHCHPEYAALFAGEVVAHGSTQLPGYPPRTVGSTTRPLMTAAGWN